MSEIAKAANDRLKFEDEIDDMIISAAERRKYLRKILSGEALERALDGGPDYSQVVAFPTILEWFYPQLADQGEAALICPACGERPDDPRLAVCAHVYCEECYTEMLVEAGDEAVGANAHLLCEKDGCNENILMNTILSDKQWASMIAVVQTCAAHKNNSESTDSKDRYKPRTSATNALAGSRSKLYWPMAHLFGKEPTVEWNQDGQDDDNGADNDQDGDAEGECGDDVEALDSASVPAMPEAVEERVIGDSAVFLELSDDGFDDTENRSEGYATDSGDILATDADSVSEDSYEGSIGSDCSDVYDEDVCHNELHDIIDENDDALEAQLMLEAQAIFRDDSCCDSFITEDGDHHVWMLG